MASLTDRTPPLYPTRQVRAVVARENRDSGVRRRSGSTTPAATTRTRAGARDDGDAGVDDAGVDGDEGRRLGAAEAVTHRNCVLADAGGGGLVVADFAVTADAWTQGARTPGRTRP